MLLGYIAFRSIFGRHPVKNNDGKQTKFMERMSDKMMGPHFERLNAMTESSAKELEQYSREELSVTAEDGVKLVGYFFPNPTPTDKTALLIHGFQSTGFVDFATVGLRYLKHGYNILMTGNRGCDKSEGKWLTFGVFESRDSMKWLDYLKERFPDGDQFIEGVSLGGATVCMMSNKNLPENVRCIISDCAFADIFGEFKYMFHYLAHLAPFPLIYTTEFWCKKIAHFDFHTESPLKAVAGAKVPILFVHGKADRYIPYQNAEELFKACPSEKELCLVEDAGHAAAHEVNPEQFDKAVFGFIEKYQTGSVKKDVSADDAAPARK